MQRTILVIGIIVMCTDQAHAQKEFFSELEDVYLTVFAYTVHSCDGDDEVFSISMAADQQDGNPVPVPEKLWERLRQSLVKKGVDMSDYVPASDVVWSEAHYSHKTSDKQVWMHSIVRLSWHGTSRLYVSQCTANGPLAGFGSTLILEKKRDKWVVVHEVRKWMASDQPDKSSATAMIRLLPPESATALADATNASTDNR